eukprot:CAMPEP_0202869402 /NCGR_PEP_ID=MMETSP1391-20130828/12434_1 /ASSEMBLY_ACC=CAM_ASM_000867 /TAXON_ID=1034604 /ORGANISM="Chlamydomonas leiostraca, Strain SAG 11-49" /LENGTH=33 /DNA_ID= /DNA_START= /DNA_END= /DNA_ORIENTATION=
MAAVVGAASHGAPVSAGRVPKGNQLSNGVIDGA